MANNFLPVTAQEMKARGWDRPDFVYIIGDAYVGYPFVRACHHQPGLETFWV